MVCCIWSKYGFKLHFIFFSLFSILSFSYSSTEPFKISFNCRLNDIWNETSEWTSNTTMAHWYSSLSCSLSMRFSDNFSTRLIAQMLLDPCQKGYRIITKTCLFKYTENFTIKNWIFQIKNFWYFSYFCSKHRLWVLVRTASTRRF